MSDANSSICGYTVFAGGNSQFFRSVSIPLIEALDEDLHNDNAVRFTKDLPDFLDVDSRPQMDAAIVIGGIVGVFAFFASWLATKVLDDIYEAKFQPAIKRALGSAENQIADHAGPKPMMLQVGISYADKRIFILVGIVGHTFAEILASEHMIATVHRNAVEWIENNSFTEQPIHLYIVNRGRVNFEPMLFDSLMLAYRHIKSIDFK